MSGSSHKSAGGWSAGRSISPAGLLLLVIWCALSGCAINPRVDLRELSTDGSRKVLETVPFYPQTEYQCGPAALAGVLGNSGVDITPGELSSQIYLPERQGSLQVELLAATRRAGRIPYELDSDLDALVRELDAGRPVLVLQNLRTRHFPVWHYAVLVGVDPQANEVMLNTGVSQREAENARKFLRTWDWAGRWAMVALRPGEFPQSPQALRYFQSVSDFERVAGAEAARAAWSAAADHWPQDSRPHLALGNIAYRSGDPLTAAQHYQQGLDLAPADAVLENNFASALAESGCPRYARERLRRFFATLGLDSPWREDIVATLNDLEQAGAEDLPHCARFSDSATM